MSTRKRITRQAVPAERINASAGGSPFADMTDEQRARSLADARRLKEQWATEKAEQGDLAEELKRRIRHGVKSERDTQPVQIRMLKAQTKVLKQVAEQEGRNSSDVIRDLVDAYITHCVETWPEGPRLNIVRSSLQAEEYTPSKTTITIAPGRARE